MNIEHHLMMENESEELKINKCFVIAWSTHQTHQSGGRDFFGTEMLTSFRNKSLLTYMQIAIHST